MGLPLKMLPFLQTTLVGISGLCGKWTFKKPLNRFCKVAPHWTFPPAVYHSFACSRSLPACGMVNLYHICSTNKYVMESTLLLVCISPGTRDAELFQMLICRLYLLWWSVSSHLLTCFLNGLFIFLLSFETSLYILDKSSFIIYI